MTHTVKSGETLSKIARAHGITLKQLLEANPQFKEDPDIVHPGDVLIIPGGEPEGEPASPGQPAPASSVPSAFAAKLATIAQGLHDRFHEMNEADPALCSQIKKWTVDIGGAFVSCTHKDHPWSAVFVSWCVMSAGATSSEFRFSKRHSVFVNKAIRDADNGRGLFHGLEITAHAPRVGDIIQSNRQNNTFSFDHARKNSQYNSHSAIVVETGQDELGRFARVIGGNESDSVRSTKVRLTPQGFIKQRGRNPFICVIKTLK
ncbi:MAG TPA: DUF2272 domain-containing protein [Longimicrobium sp.]|jgi:hypothetical protein